MRLWHNAELIKALRYCGNFEDREGCDANCPYIDDLYCPQRIMLDAAAALEAAEKRIAELEKQDSIEMHIKQCARIAELEAQMPKEGECEAKKPKTVKETEYSFYCDCPTCGDRLISNVDGEWCAGSFDRFCRMCGQRIDWSEYCGWSNMPRGARMKGEQK